MKTLLVILALTMLAACGKEGATPYAGVKHNDPLVCYYADGSSVVFPTKDGNECPPGSKPR